MSSPEQRLSGAVDPASQLDARDQQVAELQAQLEMLTAANTAAEQRAEWAAENAHALEEDMQHFVYAVSHDLRQPLRGVLTSAQLVNRNPETGEQARYESGEIIKGALEINALIERLLTYSRVASSLRRSIVPLTPVVQWALMGMEKLVAESGARITYDTLPVLDIDDSALSLLFQELFTNSILYRGEEKPAIHVSAEAADGGQTISVRDNGRGVGDEFCEKVFTPFFRLQKKEIPGHGLGLSICRKIVRAHGGKIWIKPGDGTGCTVLFHLPD